jgi:4-amino-4-deoxy-L-arabinose transferase-like glycosyltransferase
MRFFPDYFTNKIYLLYVLTVSLCMVALSSNNFVPIIWVFFSLLTVILFFSNLSLLTKRWQHLSNKGFKKKLFSLAFTIRLIAVLFLYLFFELMTGQPYEFHAADGIGYNNLGLNVSNLISSGQFNLFEKLWYIGFSDKGFPIYLGIVYSLFFNSILVVRLINALLSAWSCVLIYKFSQRSFGEKTARIAGILTMLLPNLIYYTGLHLKETLMVFLLIAFMERADYLLRSNKISFKNLIIIGCLGASLFLFRTVLGVSAFAALFGAFIFSSSRISGWSKRFFSVIWISIIVLIFLSGKILPEINEYWGGRETNLTSQMNHFATREGANKFAKYGSTAIFAPIVLVGPFPTLVHIEGQENHMMLAGAYFTRNVYAFFVLIGLFALYKQKIIRQHLLIVLFIFLYLGVLANSGFALSERFHLPALPFMLIIAAYGITQMNNKNKKYFSPYLIFISVVIIGWNWFKLAGRELI